VEREEGGRTELMPLLFQPSLTEMSYSTASERPIPEPSGTPAIKQMLDLHGEERIASV